MHFFQFYASYHHIIWHNTSSLISSSTTRKMPRILLLVQVKRRRFDVLSGILLVEGMDPEDGLLMALRQSLITEHMYDVNQSI